MEWQVEQLGHNYCVTAGGKVIGSYITEDVANERLPELKAKYQDGVPDGKPGRSEWYAIMEGREYGPVIGTKFQVRQYLLAKAGRKRRLPDGTRIFKRGR